MTPRDSERLASIETTVVDIKLRLFGNGQPGELEQLHGRINVQSKRLTRLENWKWWVVGIAVGVGMAAGGMAHKIFEAVMIP